MKQRFVALSCTVGLVWTLLAGCQPVGGIEPDKVVSNLMNVQSYEGTDNLKLELALAADTPAGYPDYSAIQQTTTAISHVKQQDKEHKSMTGELVTASGTIPFTAYKAEGETLIQVEGAKKPLLWGTAKKEDSEESGAPAFDITKLDWAKILSDHGTSLLKYMPNPESLTVTDSKVTINGQSLDLKKAHVELTGTQVAELIQGMFENLLESDDGDALIRQIVVEIAGESSADLVKNVFVKPFLKQLTTDISLMGEFAQYLNADNTLKLDLYVDGESQVRRYTYELNVSGLELYEGQVTGFKATGTSDRWNINKPVTADPIKAASAVDVSEPAGWAKYIKSLDENSAAYKLLVDGMKLKRKHIVLPPIEDGLPGEAVRPYIDPHYEVTMVPVRFVTEKLDATVEWNGDTREVTVTDIWSGKTLVFKIGSNIVKVGGQEVTLDAQAALTSDSTYVPARFIAETFGAEVGWDGETRTVSIIRK